MCILTYKYTHAYVNDLECIQTGRYYTYVHYIPANPPKLFRIRPDRPPNMSPPGPSPAGGANMEISSHSPWNWLFTITSSPSINKIIARHGCLQGFFPTLRGMVLQVVSIVFLGHMPRGAERVTYKWAFCGNLLLNVSLLESVGK